MPNEAVSQYLRIAHIVRHRRTKQPGMLDISAATWWAWVKAGKAPQPIKLSPRCTVWRRSDVLAFAESMAKEAA